jgi:hypothetical protein
MIYRGDLHINVMTHAKPSRTLPEVHMLAAILPARSAQVTGERPLRKETNTVAHLDVVNTGC